MKVGALVIPLAFAFVHARFGLVNKRVVLYLLPAVTHIALDLLRTTVIIICYKFSRIPIGARLRHVVKLIRSSSKVLPVMCVDAKAAIMLNAAEGAPNGFVIKHEEVLVFLVFMKQRNKNLSVIMREGAVEAVLALFDPLGVKEAELRFIVFRLIKLLNAIMTKLTVISVYALISVLQRRAHLNGEIKMRATLVLEIMKKHALFLIVLHLVRARGHLKS